MKTEYNRKDLLDKISRIIYMNANNMDFEQCYFLCANKYKLNDLLSHENQVMFGRRGTGKTTLLKAFCFYVNNVLNPNQYTTTNGLKVCWYTRLDECIPNGIEVDKSNTDNIVLFCIKKFLINFISFLYSEYAKMENCGRYAPNRLESIAAKLVSLSDYVEEGSKTCNIVTETQSTINRKEKDFSSGINLTLEKKPLREWFKTYFRKEKENKSTIESSREQSYVYKIDINEIKKMIEIIIQLMEFETLYICIDEFTQIDRDIPYTIQPQVAQILKTLFFNSTIMVIKIASVWNETRMQMRQINGVRMGLELGQDIFKNTSLNLDTMFDHDNNKAIRFFKDFLANSVLLYENDKNEEYMNRVQKPLGDFIVDKIFKKGCFNQLICGSQGIPRVFDLLLMNCIKEIKNRSTDRIDINIVFDSIVNNYMQEVRQSIPYSSPICVSIDNYVSKNKRKFFIVKISEYNDAINYFDGLVANNALHQCPSEQLPRDIRNYYKLYYVHYGNYLDALKNTAISLFNNEALVENNLLYPCLPSDICVDPEKYCLQLPHNALEQIYCSYCHIYFNKTDSNELGEIRCPSCNKIISWQ